MMRRNPLIAQYMASAIAVLPDEASIMTTRDKVKEERLFNKPDFLNTWKLTYSNKSLGMKANLRVNTTGGQRVSETYETESYTLWNLYVSKKPSRYFDTYIGINNIFNANPDIYGFTGGARVTGTFFYGGIAAEFR